MELSDKRYLEIDQALMVFSFRQIQALITLANLLNVQGIKIEEVEEFIKAKRKIEETNEQQSRDFEVRQKEAWDKHAPHCPVCSKVLLLRQIRIPKGKGNIKGYTSLWFCEGDGCNYEKYGYEDVEIIYKEITEGTYNADN